MRYLGGKVKIQKDVCEFLQERLKKNQPFVDLFCGACNIIQGIKADIRIANDIKEDLIELHKCIQQGWEPPDYISKEEYDWIKDNKELQDKALLAFVGFGCSYSGKYFGGYAKDSTGRNYTKNAKNSLLKKHKSLVDVEFYSMDYRDMQFRNNSMIYCDIPYKGTTGYSNEFDHNEFYRWCLIKQQEGHDVLVSEYECNTPKDWVILKRILSKQDMRNKDKKKSSTVEVIMQPKQPIQPI